MLRFLTFLFVAAQALFLSYLIVRSALSVLFDREGRRRTLVGVVSLLLIVLAALAVLLSLPGTRFP